MTKTRAFLTALTAAAAILLPVFEASADVRQRWVLDLENEKPDTFTYRYKSGKSTNVWYVVYKVKNSTEVEAPLVLDFFMRTDRGKVVHQGWYPHISAQIIRKLEKLGTMDSAELDATVEKLQGEGKYLDMSKVRQKKTLAPGQEFTGIALFEGVPWGFKTLEFLATGLADPVRLKEHKLDESPEEAAVKYELENRVLRAIYTHEGDEFYAQFDTIDFLKRDWVNISLGAVGDRKTLDLLVEALSLNDEVARRSANDLLEKLTGKSYGFDSSKSPAENEEAIRNWRSWVNQHKFNLVWDEANMKFVPKNPEPK